MTISEPWLPQVLDEKPDADGTALTLRVPETLAYFAGHFPGIPILPGVVQVHWAVHFARQSLGIALPFRRMEVIKFKELVLPGQLLVLQLRYQATAHKLEFSFRSENHEHSSGRIYFHGI
ncbi:MAG: AMP-dependent synthetase [Methylococcaceae bacterium]|nr:AMP-dependent synthetase [Methylococcaceae bacterium]